MAEQWGILANLMQGSDSRKALQRFLGLANFYCRFVQIFSQVPKLASTKETAQVVIDQVFRIHGLPVDVVSKFWKGFCQQIWATMSLSSGFHPQTKWAVRVGKPGYGTSSPPPEVPESELLESTVILD